MTELPSLSKEMDNHFTGEIVPGEVTDRASSQYVAMFALGFREYANTPPADLWSFHIAPAVKALAARLNTVPKGTTQTLPLPPECAVSAAFISADGKLPIRLIVVNREADEEHPEQRVFFIIDTLYQQVD